VTLTQRAAAWLGAGLTRSRLHRVFGGRGVVVAFHRVSDDIPEDGLTRSSRDFEQFCTFFARNYDVVPLGEFVARLERRASVAHVLAITFDDGYLDNFEVAAPILRKLGLPATFFVTTQFLGSRAVPWWDKDLARQPGWMTWDHVRLLARDGFDIGAHTRTHVDLGAIDGDEAEAEIAGSRKDILDAVGRAPVHFAYPYGRADNLLPANRERVIAAGFRCCASCHGGTVRTTDDPFRLPRVPIAPWFRTPEQLAFDIAAARA